MIPLVENGSMLTRGILLSRSTDFAWVYAAAFSIASLGLALSSAMVVGVMFTLPVTPVVFCRTLDSTVIALGASGLPALAACFTAFFAPAAKRPPGMIPIASVAMDPQETSAPPALASAFVPNAAALTVAAAPAVTAFTPGIQDVAIATTPSTLPTLLSTSPTCLITSAWSLTHCQALSATSLMA